MKNLCRLASIALAGVGGLSAQTPDNLIGLTRNIPIIQQHDHAACAGLPSCPAPGMPPAAPLPPFVGGTAWDPTRSQVWVSNGPLLAAYSMNGCVPTCPPIPCPTSSPNAFCTGLAFAESLNQLWVIDSLGAILQCQNGCPPVVVAQCRTGLLPGANAATTGLAIDEGNGLAFYSYTDFTTGVSIVHVAQIATPCQFFQRQTVSGCLVGTAFGPVTGLAVDWCRQILYLTNGRQSQAWNYTVLPGPVLTFAAAGCCTLPTGSDPIIGLCVRPGGATPTGNPCANGSCPNCPMVHSLRNEPNLGNFAFTLGLDSAPTGQLAWCVIGAGPCMPPGLLFPPLCGPIFTPGPLGTLGPMPTGGLGACNGSANFALPLPVIPTLCGAVLSSQCVVLCVTAAGGIGTALSPCLSWRLQGS
jgi:hypothetical protein